MPGGERGNSARFVVAAVAGVVNRDSLLIETRRGVLPGEYATADQR